VLSSGGGGDCELERRGGVARYCVCANVHVMCDIQDCTALGLEMWSNRRVCVKRLGGLLDDGDDSASAAPPSI
jgi:hypothetical protein